MIYLELFFTFLKIGAFTFGGGYAMLPFIQTEVQAHGWLSMEELVNFVAVSESTPGPFAVNISTYVGMETAGLPGALCATLGATLPSFVIILLVAKCFARFKSSKIVAGAMSGLKPAVIGLIGSAVISVGQTVFFADGFSAFQGIDYGFVCSLVIFAAALIMIIKKVHPILVIVLAAVLGIVSGYLGRIL